MKERIAELVSVRMSDNGKAPAAEATAARAVTGKRTGRMIADTAVVNHAAKTARRGAAAIQQVTIPRPDVRYITVDIIGETPLIIHKFADKARSMIESKQQGKALQAKAARDPKAEYEGAFHYLRDGKTYGFPANAFRRAMVAACSFIDGIPKVFAKGAFFVEGESQVDMVKLVGKPRMQTDNVRINNGRSADVRYRPVFDEWRTKVKIRYNARCISAEQLVSLLANAGFSIGIGDWRPSSPLSPGVHGQFRVAMKGE